ncbi:MAG: NapC/NirT family cytochrome c [Desulfitobacteriaceae bacterium]
MPTKDEELSFTEKASEKVNAKNIAIIFGLFVVLLGVSTMLTLKFTSQPNFCATCHEIAPLVTSWNEGQHKDVSCLECHTDPGTLGYVKRKLGSYSEIFMHFTRKFPDEKIVAKINITSCIDCHSGNSKYPKAKNIKLESSERTPIMNHAEILKNKISCLTCHVSVGHRR